MIVCAYCGKFLSYVKTKLLLVQSVLVLCLLPVAPCEERASILFVATLSVPEYCDDAPESSLLQGEKTYLFQSFFTGQVLQPFSHLYGSPLDPLQSVLIYFD